MKYFILLLSFFTFNLIHAQCDLTGLNYQGTSAPTDGCITATATTCAFFNEYSTINGLDANETYRVVATFTPTNVNAVPPYTFNVYSNNAAGSTPIAFIEGNEAPLTIDVPAGTSGTIYVKTFYDGCNDGANTCNTFTIECTSCVPATPSAASVSNILDETATVSFTEGTLIEYGEVGFTPGTDENPGVGGIVIVPATSPVDLTGLDAETTYDVYVRNNCGGPFSLNSTVTQFTTLEEDFCLDPSDLNASNITLNSADLSWSSPHSLFDVEIGEEGFIPSGTPTDVGVSSPFTATGLDAGTEYDFYVRADCGTNISDWVGPFTFSTISEGESCEAPIEINSLPFTFTGNTSDFGDNYGTADRPDISGVQHSEGTGAGGYLNGDDAVFSFTPSADGCFNFELSDIATWVGFWLFEGCPFSSVVAYHTATGSGERTLPFIELEGGVTYYIVVSTFPTPQSTPFTLTVEECPSCLNPSNLTVTNSTDEGADLSWDDPNSTTEFDVEIVLVGETPTETPTHTGVGNPFTVTGLDSDTDYDFYVRANCGAGDFSEWVGPVSFSTLPTLTCSDAPINVTHCYGDDADDQFTYVALNSGDLPTLVINSGTTEGGFDELTVYDGATTSDPILYQASGDHSGVVVQSTSGVLLVQITSDGSVSCQSGAVCCAAGLDWDVYCAQPLIFGCTDANAVNFNPDATVDDGSCILPSCSEPPLNVTHCYGNNADDQFLYSGTNPGDLPAIYVNSGITENNFDNLIIYDGPDTDAPVLYNESGNHIDTYIESTSGFLLVRITSDGGVSCQQGSACCAAGLDWDIYCGEEYTTPDLDNVSASVLDACLNEEVTLLADGAVGEVQWFDDECGGNLIGTGTSITVSLTETTTFYVRNFDFDIPSENCLSVTVAVQPSILANISASPSLEVCDGEEVELTVDFTFTEFLPQLFTLWNFNDETFDPIVGIGSVNLVGGVNSSWVSGNGSTDPAGTNRALNTSSYPDQGEDPKTAGIEVAVNTTDFENIQMLFDARASNTGANTLVVQYTLDISEPTPVWIDAASIVLTSGGTWFNENAVDFSGITDASDNPNFGVRIVTDFDQTEGEYVAANPGSNYSTGGTLRYDMISFVGIPTTPPTPDILWSNLETTENITVNQSGTFNVVVEAAGYCSDSAEVEVQVNPTIELTEDVAICDNDSIFLEGTFQNMAGTYVDTFSSILTGCDSIVTTNLSVNPTFETTVQDTICDNEFYLLPDGDSTNIADTYTFNLSSVNSCDSVVILELEVLPTFTQTISETICEGDTFTLPNGTLVFDEDMYEVTFNAQNGCDSIILVNLEVLPLSTTTLQEQICEGDIFTLPDGTEVSEEDTYEVVLQGANTCDSIVFVELNFYPDLSTTEQVEICEGDVFTLPDGTEASTADDYEFVNEDTNGCDSTHTITLQVNPLPEIDLEEEISTQESSVILDAGNFVSYEWSTNETTQTIEVTEDGTYTVTVTDDNECSNTASSNVSFLVNSIKDLSVEGLKVYPVPASDNVNIEFETQESNITLSVMNAIGSKLYEAQLSNTNGLLTHDINVSSFADGVYFIHLIGQSKTTSVSFIVVR